MAAVLRASARPKDDGFFTREELGWHLLGALRAGRVDSSTIYTAFKSLFKEQVVGCLRRFGVDRQRAERMNHEVTRRVLEYQANLNRTRGRLGGFVSKTARNLGVDGYRRTKRRAALLAVLEQSSAQAEPSGSRRKQAEAFWSNVVSLPPPHQAVTLLLLEYLQYPPRDVVQRWSSTRLDDMASWIERECRDVEEHADRAVVARCFERLRDRLALPVAKTSDKGEKARLQPIWDRPAGSVVLAAYCETDPANNLSQWSSRMKSRIRVAKLREHPELFRPDDEG